LPIYHTLIFPAICAAALLGPTAGVCVAAAASLGLWLGLRYGFMASIGTEALAIELGTLWAVVFSACVAQHPYQTLNVPGLLGRVVELRRFQVQAMARADVDILRLGDDVAIQKGMLMSPSLWLAWLKPRLAALTAAVRTVKPDVLM